MHFKWAASKEVYIRVVRPGYAIRGLKGPSFPRPPEKVCTAQAPAVWFRVARDLEQEKGLERLGHRRGLLGDKSYAYSPMGNRAQAYPNALWGGEGRGRRAGQGILQLRVTLEPWLQEKPGANQAASSNVDCRQLASAHSE